jgi:hypothetical protein
MDANRLHHIFGEPKHDLDGLVGHYGSEEAAGRAIETAVNAAFAGGTLVLDANRCFRQRFDVGGYPVIVSGRIVRGAPRVSTAWSPPR